jgi:hypothetical protein
MEYANEEMTTGEDESSSDSELDTLEKSHLTDQPQTKDDATDSSSSANGSRQKSRQVLYYQRKTQIRERRSYKPYKDQDNPSRQLRHYHISRRSTQNIHDLETNETTGCRDQSDIDSECLNSAEEQSSLSDIDDTDISDSETTETSESSSEDSLEQESDLKVIQSLLNLTVDSTW